MGKQKPILFNGAMVRAILEGKKTQTRRIVKPKYSNTHFESVNGNLWEQENVPPPEKLPDGRTRHTVAAAIVRHPEYNVGDILYIRETFIPWEKLAWDIQQWLERNGKKANYIYRADIDENKIAKGWTPSIHMLREATRIFLRVTCVRVERLQDITEEDARAEGIKGYFKHKEHGGEWHNSDSAPFVGTCNTHFSRVGAYAELWDELYAKRGFGWDTNPWVLVYEFERVEEAP